MITSAYNLTSTFKNNIAIMNHVIKSIHTRLWGDRKCNQQLCMNLAFHIAK